METEASLHIQGEETSTGEITAGVRTNGEQCPKTADPNKRYLQTPSGRELALEAENISLTAKEKEGENLKLKLDDKEGVRITSHKTLNLSAKEGIDIRSEGSVIISGNSTIMLQRGGNGKGLSLENEVNIVNSKTVEMITSDETSYENFDDEPKEAKQKKGFSWGNLFKVVVAAVAVVAAVTFGAGGILLGSIVIGATAAVGTTAIGDIARGEFSGIGTYIKEAIKGAVTNAIFGPWKGASTFIGKLFLGGVESIVGQIYERGYVDVGQVGEDFKTGALVTGIFSGIGKAIKGGVGISIWAGNKLKIGKKLKPLMHLAKDGLDRVGKKINTLFTKVKEKAVEFIKKEKENVANDLKLMGDGICSGIDATRKAINNARKAFNNSQQNGKLIPVPLGPPNSNELKKSKEIFEEVGSKAKESLSMMSQKIDDSVKKVKKAVGGSGGDLGKKGDITEGGGKANWLVGKKGKGNWKSRPKIHVHLWIVQRYLIKLES